MSQTMCTDPYPMCPQKACGLPISGCRYLGCVNPRCRQNHADQGVELKYKPPNEFEFQEKFDTQEMPWRPSRSMASQNYGYEIPFKPSRHFYTSDLIAQPTLKCNAIPTKEQPWRAQRKVFPAQTGALSEDTGGHRRRAAAAATKPEVATVPVKAASRAPSSHEKVWNPGRHQSGKAGSETTQHEFHPHRRRIPKDGCTHNIRHAKKGPGFYKRNDGEWLPPFRASTPEMVARQAPGCVPWQCPRTGKKKGELGCRGGEWQPDFRSQCGSETPPTPDQRRRPGSKHGLRQTHRRPDEWCPPWKLVPQSGGPCDPLMPRNATINEDANCTHYIDDEEARWKQQRHCEHDDQRDRGAESTEDEGDASGEEGLNFGSGGDHDFCRDDDNQENVEKCNGDHAYGDHHHGGGRPPAPSSTNWCAEDD